MIIIEAVTKDDENVAASCYGEKIVLSRKIREQPTRQKKKKTLKSDWESSNVYQQKKILQWHKPLCIPNEKFLKIQTTFVALPHSYSDHQKKDKFSNNLIILLFQVPTSCMINFYCQSLGKLLCQSYDWNTREKCIVTGQRLPKKKPGRKPKRWK